MIHVALPVVVVLCVLSSARKCSPLFLSMSYVYSESPIVAACAETSFRPVVNCQELTVLDCTKTPNLGVMINSPIVYKACSRY